jgi:hypothetical protein
MNTTESVVSTQVHKLRWWRNQVRRRRHEYIPHVEWHKPNGPLIEYHKRISQQIIAAGTATHH